MGKKKNPSACKYCGKSLGEKGSKVFCNRKCYGRYLSEHPTKRSNLPRRKRGSETLCWTCKHTNQFECSWFREDAKPVEGWKAIEKPTKYGVSYTVLECPNYESEEYL